MKTHYKIIIVAAVILIIRFATTTDYARLKELPDPIFAKTETLIAEGDNAVKQSDWNKAESLYNDALSIQQNKENKNYGLILRKLGMMHLERGRKTKERLAYLRAENYLQKALVVNQKIDDKMQILNTYAQLALTYGALGNKVKFKQHLLAQIPLHNALGQEPMNFTVYVPLAALYKLQGDPNTNCKLLKSAETELVKPEAEALAKQYGLSSTKELMDVRRQLKEGKCSV